MFEFIVLFFPGIYSASIVLSGLISRNGKLQCNAIEIIKYIQVCLFCIIVDNILALFLFSKIFNIDLTVVDSHLNQAFLSIRFLTFVFIIAIITGVIGKSVLMNFKVFLSQENELIN